MLLTLVSGVGSLESCARSKNHGIPVKPGAIRMMRHHFNHLVKESLGRVIIDNEI